MAHRPPYFGFESSSTGAAATTSRDPQVQCLEGDEAAVALGITLAAMKSRLHRARLELKERVEEILGHALNEVVQ